MSNGNIKPWYQRPAIIVPAIIGILAAVIGATLPVWLNPPDSDFSINLKPLQETVQQGSVIQTIVTIKIEHNYDKTVKLDAAEEPLGVKVTFSPPDGNVTPSLISSATINVGSNATVGKHNINIIATGSDGKQHSAQYTLNIMPREDTHPPTPPQQSYISLPANVADLFFPSGGMGDWGDLTFDDSFTNNPHSQPTSIKITYSAAKSQGQGWAGVYWQYPDKNWGDNPEGRSFTGQTKLTFWARGEKGGEKAEFKVGGISGQYPDSLRTPVSTGVIVLPNKWQQYTIGLTGKDLNHVVGGFCWVTNTNQNPNGCTIYLDDIQYEQ